MSQEVGGLKRIRARVRGRVQGVGFRAMTQHEAHRLGLGGWVRNLADGDVELEAEGSERAIQALLDHLRQGPGLARVDSVSVDWIQPLALPDGRFEIRATY